MRFLPYGPGALLVELDDGASARALAAEVTRCRAFSAVDVVPGARTVLLDGLDDVAATAREIAGWTIAPAAGDAGPLVEIECVYDGADLDDVATGWGLSRDRAVALHAATEFVVAFGGFAPGFAYLTGLPADRAVARLSSPRPRVPAGSVALAGGYCGIYPRASPGGWRLIGHTDAALWDADRDPPALLSPGTRVRFVARGR